MQSCCVNPVAALLTILGSRGRRNVVLLVEVVEGLIASVVGGQMQGVGRAFEVVLHQRREQVMVLSVEVPYPEMPLPRL